MQPTVKNVHTVSSLTYEIKNLLETQYKYIKVKGEVSNLKKQSSGHIYFTLKDKSSAISVALFAGYANKTLIPKDGDEIIIEGEISVYAPRGSYQIIARTISKTGTGDLLMKLHMLKEELSKKGYFDKEIKKPLPKFPKTIGAVTSGTGSVIKDIINVLSRRYPNFRLILNPVAVQGAGAEYEIAKAINDFNTFKLADVLIVGRGGGSLEDLFCFNEKVVAEAIFASEIPIVSACGHETDFTIADFVADVRAPTPSAAAELVVVDKAAVKLALDKVSYSICQSMQTKLKKHRAEIDKMAKSRALSSPYSMLSIFIQNVDLLSSSIDNAMKKNLNLNKTLLVEKKKSLELASPQALLKRAKEKIKTMSQHLQSINPDNLLKKGYSLIFKKGTKQIINSCKQLSAGEEIDLRLSTGKAAATITRCEETK